MPVGNKNEIRKSIIAQRDAVNAAMRRALSERVTQRLLALDTYRTAQHVMAYVSFGGEFDTTLLIGDILASGKQLILPKIERTSRSLKLYLVRDPGRELVAGVWGIREPNPELCPEAPDARIEFALVPGVAFTRRCERLGYGGGFYDRLIREWKLRPHLVAAAFELQVVPELPMSPSDQRVDLVVTENGECRRPLD